MEDFKKLPKMQHFKTGGSVKAYTKRDRKETDAADIKQDKAIVKKAFKLHDAQEHKGEKTDLSTLKKGGRAKKSVGTVKKYKCGGNVKKMADGGSLEQAALLNALPGKANELERAQMAARAKNALKYLGPAQQSEFVKQGGMTPPPTTPAVPGRKKGGKVKKYAEGNAVQSDDIVSKIREYSRSGNDIDPGMTPRPIKPYVDTDPGMGRIPKGEITIPGVGKYKTQPPKTKGDLVFLKKGGKACK